MQIGTFITWYAGDVITAQQADELKGKDAYLLDLFHFGAMHGATGPAGRAELPNFHVHVDENMEHLVVDARTAGNVVRAAQGFGSRQDRIVRAY